MILFPPAKINLGLNVMEKRTDGFHEIETLMYPVPLCDVLEVLPAEKFGFRQGGETVSGEVEDNLCVRAYRLMEREFGIGPVYMHLIKKIPMGAGLGGGSSDAASVLKAINELFSLSCSVDELKELAAELGSDCPFFILDKPQYATGRGEITREYDLTLSGYYIKIIYPGIHISTAEAYSKVILSGVAYLKEELRRPIQEWKNGVQNNFEEPVFNVHEDLKGIRESLYEEGALYASMSGSGSALYGIYNFQPERTGSENEWILRF